MDTWVLGKTLEKTKCLTTVEKPEEISLTHALGVCGLSGADSHRDYIIPEMIRIKFI